MGMTIQFNCYEWCRARMVLVYKVDFEFLRCGAAVDAASCSLVYGVVGLGRNWVGLVIIFLYLR